MRYCSPIDNIFNIFVGFYGCKTVAIQRRRHVRAMNSVLLPILGRIDKSCWFPLSLNPFEFQHHNHPRYKWVYIVERTRSAPYRFTLLVEKLCSTVKRFYGNAPYFMNEWQFMVLNIPTG